MAVIGLVTVTVLYGPSDGANLLSAVSRGDEAVTTRINCSVQSVNKGDETKVQHVLACTHRINRFSLPPVSLCTIYYM